MGEIPLLLLISPGGDGAEVIYALRNKSTLANLILNELESEGQNVRKAYQRRLPSNTAKDYYFMQRDTGDTEAITVEYGFLDSKGDDVNQLKNNWKNYAEAVVRALLEYLNLNYIPVPGGNYYTVQSGDSLWSIAKKLGVSVNELKEANNLSSSLLKVGQVLKIPSKQIIDESVYTVQSGDSLYKIANMYNISVDELKRMNNLSTNTLSVGQVLKVPKKEITEENSYIVKNGDSLYKIAQNNNTTVSELMNLNNLSTTTLSVGQVLKLPNKSSNNNSINSSNLYTVKNGDSLYKIAQNNNTTVSELMNLNNLSTTTLSIGQVLKLPNTSGTTNSSNLYTVQSGDSLYKIAQNNNTTVNELMKLNNLNSTLLSIGQTLKLK